VGADLLADHKAIGQGDGGTSWLSADVITGWPCSR
jgi:hypothetical protein